MEIPTVLVRAFPPSPDLLLSRVRRNIDDAMLRDIATADYGYQANEMLESLRQIRDEGQIPDPMPGQLIEVLELTRFCDPERPQSPPFEPGPSGQTGHHTRLFACAILLRAAFDSSGYSMDSTLANSVASAKALGDEINEALGCFFTWQFPRFERDDNLVFVAFSLLMVAVRLRGERISERSLREIADWAIALDIPPTAPGSEDRPPTAFSMQQGFWQPLQIELQDEIAKVMDMSTRESLGLCVLLLDTN